MTSKVGNRRGVAIIPVIAFYAVAMTLIAVWTKGAIREKKQVIRWHEHAQTDYLASAGVQRAIARLRQEGNAYTGEEWHISKRDIGTHDAVVEIRVISSASNEENNNTPTAPDELVRIVAIADYPAGTERKVRVTKEMVVDLTNTRPRDSGE
jgi:type II secretory pathway component PulK